jgi:hypothetical protein
MIFISILLIVLSCLVLGAHFLRFGALPLVAFCLFLPFLLFIRQPWAGRLVQLALVLGGLEWIRTVVVLIGERQAAGEPWVRMAAILGVVTLVTLVSAATFQVEPMRSIYFGGGRRPAVAPEEEAS